MPQKQKSMKQNYDSHPLKNILPGPTPKDVLEGTKNQARIMARDNAENAQLKRDGAVYVESLSKKDWTSKPAMGRKDR